MGEMKSEKLGDFPTKTINPTFSVSFSLHLMFDT